MRPLNTPDELPSQPFDAPLGEQELVALREACGPVSILGLPPATVIHALRKHGYISIVLGGIQITEQGLERLLRERTRAPARPPMHRDPAAVGPDRGKG